MPQLHTELLTAAEAISSKAPTYRYLVELASIESELDKDGFEVPVAYKTIDVVVTEPTTAAIKLLISSCQWLQGWELASFWVGEPEDAPF